LLEIAKQTLVQAKAVDGVGVGHGEKVAMKTVDCNVKRFVLAW
jgi:hypothetical protein